MSLVVGDVGTAAAYGPPYMRESTLINCSFFIFSDLYESMLITCMLPKQQWKNKTQTYIICICFIVKQNDRVIVVVACLFGHAATACGGNRVGQFPPGNLFVAVNEGLWDNGAACGRRYRIRCVSGNNRPCKGGSIDVKVVDSCPGSSCPNTLLMSNDAFAAISRFPHAKINVEYTQ